MGAGTSLLPAGSKPRRAAAEMKAPDGDENWKGPETIFPFLQRVEVSDIVSFCTVQADSSGLSSKPPSYTTAGRTPMPLHPRSALPAPLHRHRLFQSGCLQSSSRSKPGLRSQPQIHGRWVLASPQTPGPCTPMPSPARHLGIPPWQTLLPTKADDESFAKILGQLQHHLFLFLQMTTGN